MATQSRSEPETRRLERLWAGGFGDEYLLRNRRAGIGRQAFWDGLLDKYPVGRVLEVGCNAGANLQWVVRHVDPAETYGIDVSERALTVLRRRLPGVNVIRGAARELPFRDRWFDMAYTSGVLIHQPESTLPLVMSEVVRVARRFVLAVEYFSPPFGRGSLLQAWSAMPAAVALKHGRKAVDADAVESRSGRSSA